ncbi:MAG: polyprenyl synthetase family protein [Desulfosarcinaceae bacterium]|nr:polyprenyl synthetase family protein [Desulfosarcinaceae bacterium]
MPEFDFLLDLELFRRSLGEQQGVVRHFWEVGQRLLNGSGIHLKPIPKAWLSLRHNYFSVLFIAIFHLLELPALRRHFYARLNHCYRVWVTACDNLLDDELKELFDTDLPSGARIFKSVHSLLLADRIFFALLQEAVATGTFSPAEADALLNISLTAISASGREEAMEEAGTHQDLTPAQVLAQIHRPKTGLLFTAPLAAPLALGDIHASDPLVEAFLEGLEQFGIGCQILDDLSDLGADLAAAKHNYLAATIAHGTDAAEKKRLAALSNHTPGEELVADSGLYRRFPKAAQTTLQAAIDQLEGALRLLADGGLPLGKTRRRLFLGILTTLYGHPNALLNIRSRR